MKIAFFSTKPYDERFFDRANAAYGHQLNYFESRLNQKTVDLARAADCVCVFVNDELNEAVLTALAAVGVRLIALRCAGFNNVDLAAAKAFGLTVVRVPAYSPHAVAEHTLALMLALNRRVHKAFNRVREANFALEGLLGFDLRHKTIGVIGTGKIGVALLELLSGFGMTRLAYDPFPKDLDKQVRYVSLAEMYEASDIITLHCPLTPETHYLVDAEALKQMKSGVMLINTSRGALIDTKAVISALKQGKVGYLGLDVYEEEADLFFEDLSGRIVQDDTFMRLLTFPNVLITGHQGFFTQEALYEIAETTLRNITSFETGYGQYFEVSTEKLG